MEKNEIIGLYSSGTSWSMAAFVDALIARELHFTSKSLKDIYRTDSEMDMAISRAMRVCQNIGLPLDRHFRQMYISDNTRHSIERGWKMSKVAYCLTLVNGDPGNPVVGRMQWELIKRMV